MSGGGWGGGANTFGKKKMFSFVIFNDSKE